MNSPLRYKQLTQLTLAYARQIIREPGVLFWGIAFPILMSLGLGIAFTKKADIIRDVAWIATKKAAPEQPVSVIKDFLVMHDAKVTKDKEGNLSYRLTIPDDKLGNTTFTFRIMDWQKAMVLLKRGNLTMIIGESDRHIDYHFDPLNPDAQLIYLKLSNLFQDPSVLQRKDNISIKPLTVTGTRYVDFLVPGLIAMGVMMSIMWGISYEIIDNRAKKLLRRMVATPMKKSHYLIALMLSQGGNEFRGIGASVSFYVACIRDKSTGKCSCLTDYIYGREYSLCRNCNFHVIAYCKDRDRQRAHQPRFHAHDGAFRNIFHLS